MSWKTKSREINSSDFNIYVDRYGLDLFSLSYNVTLLRECIFMNANSLSFAVLTSLRTTDRKKNSCLFSKSVKSKIFSFFVQEIDVISALVRESNYYTLTQFIRLLFLLLVVFPPNNLRNSIQKCTEEWRIQLC